MKPEDIVVNLVRLNGRHIDCDRLQWEAYLLSRCGAKLKVRFIYRHGGPYSHELALGWENARYDGRIVVKEMKTRHGTPYWVYRSNDEDREPGSVEGLGRDLARRRLKRMGEASDLVLELASAFVFLQREGKYKDRATKELEARKPRTTRNRELVKRAHRLLSDLKLRKLAA